MPFGPQIAAFAASIVGRLVLTGGLLAGLVALRACDVHQQRNIGAAKRDVAINEANDNGIKMGKRAAARSMDERVRKSLPRDPLTRDD